jgi:DNA-binding XRE family transcriptional regulator
MILIQYHEVAGDVGAERRTMVQLEMGGDLWAPLSLAEEKRDESIWD